MTKRALVAIVVLAGLLASEGALATRGFRPGLWAIHEIFTGSLQFTSDGLQCLQTLGQGQNSIAVLGAAGGPSGPVAIHIKRGIHKTEAIWHDDLHFGSMTNIDRGRYTFTDRAQGDLLRGSWTRTQIFLGRTTVLHASLRGHWVASACPSTLPSATLSSPTLAALAAQNSRLKASVARAQAQMAQVKKDKFP